MSTPANPAASLDALEALARERLPHLAYEYIASGAADEITVGMNREALVRIRLRPSFLPAPPPIDISVALLGERLPHPILIAPTAYHRLVHPDGEIATARGAGDAEAIFVVSTATTVTLEEIAAVARSPLWFQLYVQSRPEFTEALVRIAEEAGCRALCVTVDNARLGARNRQARSDFRLPEGVSTPYLDDLNAGRRDLMVAEPVSITWADIERFRSITALPVLLKGILTADDARRAVDCGVAGIIVSNHAGRNLDTAPATIEALPEVVAAVGGAIPVLVDGGIRRGSDVLKALALGAAAVLIGRPGLYGLGVAGADGVREVVEILCDELRAALSACGLGAAMDAGRAQLWAGGR